MREIGRITDEADARIFRDFLFNQGVVADTEPTRAGGWSVWVHDEDRMDEAAAWLARFQANPKDVNFLAGAEGADRKRAEMEKAAPGPKHVRRIGGAEVFAGMGWGTISLLVSSILVTLAIRFGDNQALVQRLSIAELLEIPGRGMVYYQNLLEVRSGQVWRLFTPLFMHFNLLHIIFNMMWMRDLGGMIERQRSTVYLLVFTALAGGLSNVAQFYVGGPSFGGMSGVVYAMLGYVWMQSRYNPWSGFVLHPTIVQMMLIWFLVCLTGLVGSIANTAHGAGLALGVAWGYFTARRAMRA